MRLKEKAISYVGGITKKLHYPIGKWPGGTHAWGSDRILLEPDTDAKGREKLSIHGGHDFGSAGCIDLAGGMDNFMSYFDSHGEDMDLIVKYPDWF